MFSRVYVMIECALALNTVDELVEHERGLGWLDQIIT